MDVPARAGGPASTGTEDDPLAAARKLYEFVKQFNERLRILGAVFSGRYQGAEAATALAQIPGRQVLLGRLAGMLAYPTRKLVITCGQIRKQKENQSN
jgi:ribosomal protein L10